MIKKKKLLKILKRESKKIAPKTYWAIDKYYQPVWEDDANGRFTFNGQRGEWKTGIAVEYPVNHYRRIKRAYNRYGWAAVRAYFIVHGGLDFIKQLGNYEAKNSNNSLP